MGIVYRPLILILQGQNEQGAARLLHWQRVTVTVCGQSAVWWSLLIVYATLWYCDFELAGAVYIVRQWYCQTAFLLRVTLYISVI
jgi:hypothetical protein